MSNSATTPIGQATFLHMRGHDSLDRKISLYRGLWVASAPEEICQGRDEKLRI